MRLSLEFYHHLREKVRISDIVRKRVSLTKKGREYLGRCPFHQEKTPSFTVNDAKAFYHCFGCNAHGDIIRFVAETEGMSYKEAAIKIAEDNNIAIPKVSQYEAKIYEETENVHHILDLANQFFVSKINNEVYSYLTKRGINEQTIKDFSIGYAPGNGELEKFFKTKSFDLKDLLKCGLFGKNEDGKIYEIFNKRIMFPIKNFYNKIIAFGGRAVGTMMPKYINSPETIVFKKSEAMFGEHIAISYSYKNNHSILVEGYMDVIALHQAGFKQTVASLGTAVTNNHLSKIWRVCDEVIVCLDGDAAGIRASNRVIDMALPNINAKKSVSFIQLPNNLDPDDLIKTNGSEAFNQLLSARNGLSEMIWKIETEGKLFPTPELRAALEEKLDSYCRAIKHDVLRINFKRYFKDMIWQNILRFKKHVSSNKSAAHSIITSSLPTYTEIEFIEHAVCAFMLKFPEAAHGLAKQMTLNNTELNELKDFIVEFVDTTNQDISVMLEEEVKNSGFHELYLVLSSSGSLFLDAALSGKENINQKLVFELLYKKHYLLSLKQEYIEISGKDHNADHPKLAFYIKEIQKITNELNKLSESFIN